MIYILAADGKILDQRDNTVVEDVVQVEENLISVPHLAPFVFSVYLPKGDSVKIRVAFSCHCFTEALDKSKHVGQAVIMDHLRPRAFDQIALRFIALSA